MIVSTVHSCNRRSLSVLHIVATFLFLCEWKHPPPSCAEHIVIGRCPEPVCADWLAQAVVLYNWPIICCRSHPRPALERSGTVEKERKQGLWVFLAPLRASCVSCVNEHQCFSVKMCEFIPRYKLGSQLRSTMCHSWEGITLGLCVTCIVTVYRPDCDNRLQGVLFYVWTDICREIWNIYREISAAASSVMAKQKAKQTF